MDILKSGAAELGISLNPEQLDQFETYYQELIGWTSRVNLTSVTDRAEVQTRHFLDSLSVIKALDEPLDSRRIIDVGAGAGLPGLPLKIAFPGLKLTLLEATGKKTKFLEHIVGTLGLEDVGIVTARAEAAAHLKAYRERYDIVVSRAVAELDTLAELTLPFCAVGGRVIAQKKEDISEEISRAQNGVSLLGGRLAAVRNVSLPGLEDDRKLVVLEKISVTPPQYPRRAGIPAKRPLV